MKTLEVSIICFTVAFIVTEILEVIEKLVG